MNTAINPRYVPAILCALGIQVGLLLFAEFSGPRILFVCACRFASFGFWVGVLIVLIRRPRAPTCGDLWYVRKGLLLVGVIGMALAFVYWDYVVGVMDPSSPFNARWLQ